MINKAKRPGSSIYHFLFTGAVLLCLSAFIASCSQDRQPCLTPKIASLNLECVHYPTDSAITTIDTALPKAIFIALTDSGQRGVIYPTSSTFTLSLSSVSDTCRWLMATDSTLVANNPTRNLYDTLSFFYRRKLQFLSNACGYTYFYSLDSVHYTHISIDSILITNTSVTNDVNIKQLQIYIHPSF